MRLRIQFFILLFISFLSGFGQLAPGVYWVQFTDKTNTPYSIDKPEEFLSGRSLQRREKHHVEVTVEDLPVDPVYIDSLEALGLELLNISKWFNGVSVRSYDLDLVDTLHHLSFVKHPLRAYQPTESAGNPENKKYPFLKASPDYGDSFRQIEMLNGHLLHEMGYAGEGVLIAVHDAGFTNVDKMTAFAHLWDSGKIMATRDFVHDNKTIFNSHDHGSKVLSCMGSFLEGELIGTAYNATYVLLRTENADSEYLIEEHNWLSAAEFADSIGADIINSSLGYSTFNDSRQDHLYEDLDGKTTPVTRAARIASNKGILVVNSAGNAYRGSWKYILAPSDADSILTVGAVDADEYIASFSSRGPTYDGRIKPDVAGMGSLVTIQASNNLIQRGNGTSYSSPIIAGMVACLLQSNPGVTNMDIINAVIESGDRFFAPDTTYGYGIPDFMVANRLLKNRAGKEQPLTSYNLFPNPVIDRAHLELDLPWLSTTETGQIMIYDLQGRLLQQHQWNNIRPGYNVYPLDIYNTLDRGYYIIFTHIKGRKYSLSLLKL